MGAARELVVGRHGRRGGATHERVHAAHQLHHAERLGQVVVGAGIEAAHRVELRALGREHHDGQVLRGRVLPQHVQDLQAVHLGQHDVQQHELRQAPFAGDEELPRRGKARRLETGLLERVHRKVADIGIVFNVVDHRSCSMGSPGRPGRVLGLL